MNNSVEKKINFSPSVTVLCKISRESSQQKQNLSQIIKYAFYRILLSVINVDYLRNRSIFLHLKILIFFVHLSKELLFEKTNESDSKTKSSINAKQVWASFLLFFPTTLPNNFVKNLLNINFILKL